MHPHVKSCSVGVCLASKKYVRASKTRCLFECLQRKQDQLAGLEPKSPHQHDSKQLELASTSQERRTSPQPASRLNQEQPQTNTGKLFEAGAAGNPEQNSQQPVEADGTDDVLPSPVRLLSLSENQFSEQQLHPSQDTASQQQQQQQQHGAASRLAVPVFVGRRQQLRQRLQARNQQFSRKPVKSLQLRQPCLSFQRPTDAPTARSQAPNSTSPVLQQDCLTFVRPKPPAFKPNEKMRASVSPPPLQVVHSDIFESYDAVKSRKTASNLSPNATTPSASNAGFSDSRGRLLSDVAPATVQRTPCDASGASVALPLTHPRQRLTPRLQHLPTGTTTPRTLQPEGCSLAADSPMPLTTVPQTGSASQWRRKRRLAMPQLIPETPSTVVAVPSRPPMTGRPCRFEAEDRTPRQPLPESPPPPLLSPLLELDSPVQHHMSPQHNSYHNKHHMSPQRKSYSNKSPCKSPRHDRRTSSSSGDSATTAGTPHSPTEAAASESAAAPPIAASWQAPQRHDSMVDDDALDRQRSSGPDFKLPPTPVKETSADIDSVFRPRISGGARFLIASHCTAGPEKHVAASSVTCNGNCLVHI